MKLINLKADNDEKYIQQGCCDLEKLSLFENYQKSCLQTDSSFLFLYQIFIQLVPTK